MNHNNVCVECGVWLERASHAKTCSQDPYAIARKQKTFVLWGKELSPGDTLLDEELAQLRVIADHPKTGDGVRAIVLNLIAKNGEAPSYQNLLAVVDSQLPEAPPPADEITTRAREAFIALGDMAGSEMALAIREGRADHLVGIRGAIQVLRDIGLDIDDLRRRVPAERTVAEVVAAIPRAPTVWDRIGKYLYRCGHRFVRLWSRYDHAAQRKLSLAADIVLERREAEQQRLELQGYVADHLAEIENLRKENEIAHTARELATKRMNDTIARNKALEAEAKLSDINSGQLESMFNRASPRERVALLELAQHALAARRIDPETGEIVLSMRVPKDPKISNAIKESLVPYGDSGVKRPGTPKSKHMWK